MDRVPQRIAGPHCGDLYDFVKGLNPKIAVGGVGRSGDLGPADCVLPANHEEIRRTVAGNLHDGPAIETDAPPTVVMELLNRQKTRERIVHFVNFDHGHPVAPFAMRLKKQLPGAVKAVKLFSPQSDEPKELPFTEERGRIAFTAPARPLPAMIVVEHR